MVTAELLKPRVEVDEDDTEEGRPIDRSILLSHLQQKPEQEEQRFYTRWQLALYPIVAQKIQLLIDTMQRALEQRREVPPQANLVLDAFRVLNWKPDDPPYSYKGIELINREKDSPYWSDNTNTIMGLLPNFTRESSSGQQSIQPRQLLELLVEEIAKGDQRPWLVEMLRQQMGKFEREIEISLSHFSRTDIELIPGVSVIFSANAKPENTYKVGFKVDKKAVDAAMLDRLEFIADWLTGPALIEGITKKLIQLSKLENPPIFVPLTDVSNSRSWQRKNPHHI